VREPAEFEAGAIPGATLIPLGQLRSRLGELPKERTVVIYCAVGIRGYLAERILRQNGFRARNLDGGFTTWKLFHPPRTPQPAVAAAPCLPSVCGAPLDDLEREAPAAPAEPVATLDVRGQQCPGPIVAVKQALDGLPAGATLRILASDRGFLNDLPAFCGATGHALLELKATSEGITALVAKAAPAAPASVAAAAPPAGAPSKRTTIVLFSNDLDKALAGLIIANGFAALGHEVNVFCTFWGLSLLRKEQPPALRKGFLDRMFGWMLPRGPRRLALSKLHFLGAGTALMKQVMAQKGAPDLPGLLGQAKLLGVKFLACEMAMNVMGIRLEELIDGVEPAGVANFAALAEKGGPTLFI
jgi:peroxiredoxin family protein/TusA-related sulfurtransferase